MNLWLNRWIDRLADRVVRAQERAALRARRGLLDSGALRIIGNSNLGYRRIGDTLTFYVASSLQTGLANDADAAPTYLVYEEENATQIVTSTSMALLDSADTNGLYSEQITLAEATGYEFQKDYLIYITATISSIASHALYSFRIGPEGAVDSANAQAGAAGTITLKSGASATDDLYNGMLVVIIGGTGVGQARTITDYVGSTRVATIEPNWITNPSSSSIYALYHHGRVAVHTGGIVAASFGAGAIDAAAIATGAIDADAIADGAIDAGAIATGAIDADALATDAVNEIADGVWDEPLAGHTTAGTTGEAQNTIDDILADTNDIQTRLPATLNGGRMRSHVEAMDAGTITAAVIATDAIDADALATSAVDEIIAAVTGTADSGSTTTLVDAARTEADTDYWKGSILLITSGSTAGQLRLITAFDPGTDTITVDPAFTQAISTNDYKILKTAIGTSGAGGPTAADIADAVWDEDIVAAHGTADTSGLILSQLTRRAVTFNTAVDDDSIIGQIADDGTATFDRTTDSLQAIADSGGGGPTAADIADAVWDEARAGHVAAGSFGEYVLADAIRISGDDVAADRFETMLDGTGGNKLTLEQLRINSTTAAGGIDIDNSAGPAISARAATGDAVEMVTAGGNGRGLYAEGNGSGAGIRGQGGATGHGFHGFAGLTSGDGFRVQAQGNGHGFQGIGGGTAGNSGIVGQSGVDGHGFYGFGDGAGDGMRLEGGITGFDLNADIQGNLSGSVGSVTGNVGGNVVGSVGSVVGSVGGNVVGSVGSVVGNVGGNVTGSVGSVLGNVGGNVVGSVGSVAAGGITAASIATDAIDADALAADAVAEIQSGLATSAAVAAIQADTDDIQTRLPASLVGGRMRSHVEAMDAGTITAAVIATNAIDADALATDAVNEIVDQTWDELLAGHLGVGSTGEALSDAAAGGGGPSAADIADAVWDELRAGHVIAGSFGEGVASVQGNVTGSVAGSVGSVVGNVGGNVVGSVGSVTGNVGGNVVGSVGSVAAGGITAASFGANAIDSSALATSAVDEIVDGVWDELIAGHLGVGTTGEALSLASTGGTADWTAPERSQIRQALGITGATAATTGTGTLELALVGVQADTDDLQLRLPATLNAGRMRSHVEACDPPCTPSGGGGGSDEFEADPL